ncbi:Rab guanyl-nucleotide exchange factor [Fragilaria crotonensis]|nr:Rab guanyl-nucleotide exchange factor [Fragilaria crotonensis]
MTKAAATTGMGSFRMVLKHAFIICALDGRRLPFLSRHFATIKSSDDDGDLIHTEDTQMVNASVELMLFLELAAFVELYGATPKSRRRDIAKRIAFKFFLPSKIGNRVEKPMFDFSHIVEEKDLTALRDLLLEPGGNDQAPYIHRGAFLPFQEAVVERLHGSPFISFLMSDECARMRGYLRDTAPYRTVSPGDIFHRVVAAEDDAHSVNHLLYNVVYLLCQRERETCGENDDIVGEKSSRVMGAAGGLCCAVFIKKTLLRIVESADVELDKEASLTSQVFKDLRNAYEQAWQMFLSPHGGALELLSNSNETEDELATVQLPSGISSHKPPRIPRRRTKDSETEVNESQLTESPEIVSSSASAVSYPNAHFAIVFGTDDGTGMVDRSANPTLSQFDIRRYTCQQVLVDVEGRAQPALCRVPATIETYAILPLPQKSHFSQLENAGRVSGDGWVVSMFDFMIPGSDSERSQDAPFEDPAKKSKGDLSVDASEEEEVLPAKKDVAGDSLGSGTEIAGAELTTDKSVKGHDYHATNEVARHSLENETDNAVFSSPITNLTPDDHSGLPRPSATRVFRVATDTPSFNKKLTESSIDRVKKQRLSLPSRAPVSIGIVLVSSQNTIFAMRQTLWKLLDDFSIASNDGDEEKRFVCKSIVELLGNFAHLDVEHASLSSILQPYLRFGSQPWTRQNARLQDEVFGIESGQRLMESLPLVPLALLYIAVLLEQKVVFSSSRRGILLAAATAITRLLHPFKWEHLVVPLVPSTLARDLLEYPAPFIIGLSADDEGNLELLNSLPDDVTLVDLDVGRVILAPSIAFGEETSTSEFSLNPRSKSIALRSQILYLAQALGVVFGSRLRRQAWCGDSPLSCMAKPDEKALTASFIDLQAICASFLMELVAGTEACYWIEEHQPADAPEVDADVERTVLFDEDRFFQIKNHRAMRRYEPLFRDSPGVGEFALSLDDFDLVLECFLRCQGMSSYISSRPKTAMAFS